MSSFHWDALKSLSPQVDEFIIKVHKWTGSPHKDALKLLKFTSGQVYYKVHKWMGLSHKDALKLSSPQVDEFIIKSTSG